VPALALLEALRWRGKAARSAALAMVSGALAAYSHPGIGLAPLMPVALIALAFWTARSRSNFAAISVGFAFGVGIFSVITIASRDWALVVPIALTLIGTHLYAVPQAILAFIQRRRTFGPAAFCGTAAAWKLCMDAGDYLGFPTMGEGLAAVAGAPVLMGGARLFGSSTACGIMIAGTLGCGVRLAQLSAPNCRQIQSALKPLPVAIAVLLLSSGVAHLTAPKASGSLNVGIPQMNVPSAYFEQRIRHPELADAFEDVMANQLQVLAGVDMLALTETHDGGYSLLVPKVRQRFQNYARQQQQAVLLSSYLAAEDGGIYNAVGSIDANGKLVGVHRKVNLAPFGEVDFEAGTRFQSASVLPGVQVGILICQESLLTDGPHALAKSGANVLISPTSDVSFHSGLLGFEHLALARMRAIETGRAVVWASAAGPSGGIDRWGSFDRAGPFRAPAAVRVNVALHDEQTPYLRSIWLWRVLAVVAILTAALARRNSHVLVLGLPSPVSTCRGYGELVLAIGLTWAAAIGSAGAVEVVNGTPQRALRSVKELIGHQPLDIGPGSLERFRADVAQSASAAMAYYLDFYGQRTLPSAVLQTSRQPTLAGIASELETSQAFLARLEQFDFDSPPRVAAIVRTKAGEFCVTTSDRSGRIQLFRPTTASVEVLDAKRLRSLIEPLALLPRNDPELKQR